LMRLTLKLPSGCLRAAVTASLAPGFRSPASPITYFTIGVSGDTTIFCSPPLYLTVITGPLTPVTVAPTVPFVMVEPGCVHGRKPSPVPRIDSAKMCTSTAFCVPSGCGMAPLPMNSPSLTSASDAFSTRTTITLSARLSFSESPFADFAVTVWPSTLPMTPARRSGFDACARADVTASAPPKANAAPISFIFMSLAENVRWPATCRPPIAHPLRRHAADADVDAGSLQRAIRLLLGIVDGDVGARLQLVLAAGHVHTDFCIRADNDFLLATFVRDGHDLTVDAGNGTPRRPVGHGRMGLIPRPESFA